MIDSLGGKGILGILAVITIVCLVLYFASSAVVQGGFGIFLNVGIGTLVVLVILGALGLGGGSLIAKFR